MVKQPPWMTFMLVVVVVVGQVIPLQGEDRKVQLSSSWPLYSTHHLYYQPLPYNRFYRYYSTPLLYYIPSVPPSVSAQPNEKVWPSVSAFPRLVYGQLMTGVPLGADNKDEDDEGPHIRIYNPAEEIGSQDPEILFPQHPTGPYPGYFDEEENDD